MLDKDNFIPSRHQLDRMISHFHGEFIWLFDLCGFRFGETECYCWTSESITYYVPHSYYDSNGSYLIIDIFDSGEYSICLYYNDFSYSTHNLIEKKSPYELYVYNEKGKRGCNNRTFYELFKCCFTDYIRDYNISKLC